MDDNPKYTAALAEASWLERHGRLSEAAAQLLVAKRYTRDSGEIQYINLWRDSILDKTNGDDMKTKWISHELDEYQQRRRTIVLSFLDKLTAAEVAEKAIEKWDDDDMITPSASVERNFRHIEVFEGHICDDRELVIPRGIYRVSANQIQIVKVAEG
jgi:hypothetical protein